MTELEFKDARCRAMLEVQAKHVKQIGTLEQNFKRLQSEYNVLKRTYLNLLEDHIGIIDGKNKTIKVLREKAKKQRDEYNKLLEREQNKGWNELD